MLIIDIRNSESLERALKQLKRKVTDTKQLQNLRNRKEFEKPSVKGECKMIDENNISELVNELQNVTKVI